MLKTNEEALVRMQIEGHVSHASVYPNTVGHDGSIHNLPGPGGITLNIRVGDPAFGWAADHAEPGVSTLINAEKRRDKQNVAYNFLACLGNEAQVLTGKAKGAKGIVTGVHGGAEHVLLDFPKRTMEQLSCDDRFGIRAVGQGLALTDCPDVGLRSLDPALLRKLGLKRRGDTLEVPVAAIIPGALMGSGLGEAQSFSGDYDLMTSDRAALERHLLTRIKLGDVVAITDHDGSYGWRYLEGAVVIGVVAHCDSHLSGHGPGITTIMTSAAPGRLVPKRTRSANIARYLHIGRHRRK